MNITKWLTGRYWVGNHHYRVRYTEINTSPEADPKEMFDKFQFQISKIAPYDDAEYFWASGDHGVVKYICNGKVKDKTFYFNSDDMNCENNEWCDEVINQVVDKLDELNKTVEPRMVYNSKKVTAARKPLKIRKVTASAAVLKASGKWADILKGIEDAGYEIDSVSKEPCEWVTAYKDGIEYEIEVTKYSDGSYEATKADEVGAKDDLIRPEQKYSSAKTSINSTKLPAIYNLVHFPEGSVVMDFGGGKFDNGVEYLASIGCEGYVYDPYNRDEAHNKAALAAVRKNGGADITLCSNVLNVIKEYDARIAVLNNIKKVTKPSGTVYITVYEGSGKSDEGETKSGYQLNRKTAGYMEEVQSVFPDATRKGKLIVATNDSSVKSGKDVKTKCPLNCAEDTEYIRLKREYSNLKEFRDRNKQSGHILDLTEELESKGLPFEIYNNKSDDGCTVFYDTDGINLVYGSQSVDQYDEYSFMVGDQLEWSGLYGGNYRGVVTKVEDDSIFVDVEWIAEDTGKTCIDHRRFELTTDPAGRECIIVWRYGGDAGYVYPPYDNIIASSYGGAYDVEDDQYFTKEDIVDFGNTVCDHLNEIFYDTYDIADVYMETPKKLALAVVQQSDGSEFTATIDIDMRKIRSSADLSSKYLGEVVNALRANIQEYNQASKRYSELETQQATNGEASNNDVLTLDDKMALAKRQMRKAKHANVESAEEIDINNPYLKKAQPKFDTIKKSIQDKIIEVMTSYGWGFSEDEAISYSRVDIKPVDHSYIKIEVGVESGFEGMEEVAEAINPIVAKLDSDAYFDFEEPGIMSALVNYRKIAASKIVAGYYDVPERPLDPPESDWDEIDYDPEEIELDVDAIVTVDDEGWWEYSDTSYPWAKSPNDKRGDWYSYDDGIYLGDATDMVEHVDDLLSSMMPPLPGTYHITAKATLVFDISGVYKRVIEGWWDDRHGYEEDYEISTDDAEVEFNFGQSRIENFEVEEVDGAF